MKRIFIFSIVALTFVMFFAAIELNKHTIKAIFYDDFSQADSERVLGLYDFSLGQVLPQDPISHYSITWKNTAIKFDESLLKQISGNEDLLLTVQTWSKDSFFSSRNDNVLQETLDGEFDDRIAALGKILSKSTRLMLVRWNPDMELPVNNYPWQQQSPLLYIRAFNYFSHKLKAVASNVKIVWGPNGYPGDTEYYPGKENVDFVSVSLRSDFDLQESKGVMGNTSMGYILRQKLHRMRFIGKDVLLIGPENGKSSSLGTELFQKTKKFLEAPEAKIYFNGKVLDTYNRGPSRMSLEIGLYDPKRTLVTDPKVSVEHIFIDWGQIEDGTFDKNITEIASRNHSAIVTVEPWRSHSQVPDSNVLVSMMNGRYDKQIKALINTLAKVEHPVYLRFAHEMEIPIHRYAWQSQDPVTYISAYRYFMSFLDSSVRNIKRVWGPAGDRGSIDFWPGDDVVDFISIAIYGLPDKNISDHTKQESFEEIFNRKIYRVRFTAKPIFITEFGVKGPETFQSSWLQAAAKTIKNNKFVFGVCYFNLFDNPEVWGKNMDAPDWSISQSTFDSFCEKVRPNQ